MGEFNSFSGLTPGPTVSDIAQSAASRVLSTATSKSSAELGVTLDTLEAKISELVEVALQQDEKLMFLLHEAVKRRVLQEVMSGSEVDEIDADILMEELL